MKNPQINLTTTKNAIFMMGAPASGKGYTRTKLFPTTTVFDCDSVKAEHPDYDPKNPQALHVWSSLETMKRINTAINTSDEDFIYDGTGANATRLIDLIEKSQKNGFNCVVVYVKVSLKTSLARNAKRERVVPTDVVIDKYEQVQKSFEIVAPHANTLTVINNEN